MARVPLTIDLADPATGNAVSGATCTVKDVAGANATLYAARTGPTNVANPLITNSSGMAQCWVDRGLYRLVFGGGVTRPDEWFAAAATDNAEIDTAWASAIPADDSIVAQKLDPATVRAILGLNATGQVRRGKSIVATTETLVTPVAYAFAATPDRVQNVILPTDGIIRVRYQATWQESVAAAARAAIFLGATQLQAAKGDAAGASAIGVCEAGTGAAGAGNDVPLSSCPVGLVSGRGGPYSGDVTTGQIFGLAQASSASILTVGGLSCAPAAPFGHGGHVDIWAAAGTYDVGVKFKASSGNVTVKNRRLMVEVVSFG